MQHIHEADHVKAFVGMGDRLPVEKVHGDMRGRAGHDVDAAHGSVGRLRRDQFGNLSVARAHIQNCAASIDQRAQRLAQNGNAAIEDDAFMQLTKSCRNHVSHLFVCLARVPKGSGATGSFPYGEGFRRY
jgi:hypothetical protein